MATEIIYNARENTCKPILQNIITIFEGIETSAILLVKVQQKKNQFY